MAESSDTKHSSHPGMVAHFDPKQIHGSSKNHAASTFPTIAQVLRDREASNSMPNGSASIRNDQHHHTEHNHGSPHKRSVIAKVKEKARRLGHSLSRKKHSGDNLTPHSDPGPGGLGLDHPQDFTLAGFESTLAPGDLSDQPRANPSEKQQVFSSNVNFVAEHKCPISSKSEPALLRNSLSNTVTVKAEPAHVTISEPTNATTSKLQSHADSATTEHRNNAGKDLATTEKSIATADAVEAASQSTAAAPVSCSSLSNAGEQKWDKGISVREYLMHKFEPGEDERVLSQVISEAMTPRTTRSHDSGVVGRVREVVHSLLRSDQKPTTPANDYHHSAGNSSENIPISTNSHEVVEQSPERILQAN